MDISSALAILGIVATVVLGIWAIGLAIRFSRQVEVAYIEDNCVSLIDDITQGIGELKIHFRGAPVSQNLVLLKAYFVNRGKRDITPSMVEKRLRLTLPERYEWKDCQITDRSKDLKLTVAGISPNAIEFDFGLFKTREFFKFDALATVPIEEKADTTQLKIPPNSTLRAALDFDYRIADTARIQRLRLSDLHDIRIRIPRPNLPILRWSFRFFSVPILIGMLATFPLQEYVIPKPRTVAYRLVGPDNQETTVLVRAKGDQVELYDSGGFSTTLPTQEFDRMQKTAVVRTEATSAATYFLLAYSAFAGFALVVLGWRYALRRRYLRILRL